jgi:hypothetical protein
VDESYPFGKGWSSDYEKALDYVSFTVECIGNDTNEQDMSSVKPAMELLLANPDELKKKQLALPAAVVATTYGLGHDAHRHEDAFAHVIRSLRAYLDNHVSA